MDTQIGNQERRRVLIRTTDETVEGCLLISSMQRTLDDLNVVSPGFLIVDVEETSVDGWFTSKGRTGINTASILFVNEVSAFKRAGRRVEAARFNRAPVRLRVGDFEIQGFMHVPGRGDPMSRLNHDERKFIAITSASILGPGLEFATPFLAVNRQLISAAQEVNLEEDDLEAVPETVGEQSV